MKNTLLITLFLFTFSSINAQETEILKNRGSWLSFINKVKLSEKFYLINVTQQRRLRFLKETQSYLIAPSINYKLFNNVSVGTGYLFYKYFPHSASSALIHKNENRLFQHITLTNQTGKFKIGNRLMFEERVIETIDTSVIPNIISGDKYVNRLRYRLRATTNLFKLKNNHYILGRISEEIRIKFSDGITEPDFDQSNFEALLGYKLLNNSTIWAGYGRYYAKRNSLKYVSNDILHITLSYNFDITKKV